MPIKHIDFPLILYKPTVHSFQYSGVFSAFFVCFLYVFYLFAACVFLLVFVFFSIFEKKVGEKVKKLVNKYKSLEKNNKLVKKLKKFGKNQKVGQKN